MLSSSNSNALQRRREGRHGGRQEGREGRRNEVGEGRERGRGKGERRDAGRKRRERGDPLVSKLLTENINSTKSIKRAFFSLE